MFQTDLKKNRGSNAVDLLNAKSKKIGWKNYFSFFVEYDKTVVETAMCLKKILKIWKYQIHYMSGDSTGRSRNSPWGPV